MAFNRGSSSVYDLWESMNNSGWGWNSVFPYFKKYAHFTPPNTTNNSQITFNPSYYNKNAAPLEISYGQYTQPYDQYWYPALQEIGVPKAVDFNGGNAVGVAHTTTSINPADETRSSAYTTYYAAAKSRPNFHIMSSTMVNQILIRKNGSITNAYGVKYTNSSGVPAYAYASKEVIVAAGAVQTPQLLMLSGIGPKVVLDKFNIPSYAYLKGLGQRFQDHPSFYVNIEVDDSLPTIGMLLRNSTAFGAAFNEWSTSHTGPLASMNGDTLGFQRFTDDQLKAMGANDLLALGSGWPNIEFLLLPAYNNPGFPNPPNATGNYLTVLVALVSPTSMGSVTIRSTNINDPPVIDVNYLSTTDDQKVAIQGFKNAIAIAQSNAFKPVFLGRDKVVPPAASVTTDGQILEYVRNTITTIWHGSGTAAMMPQASGGVVDSKLRVYGVKNLRIVDASIQPRITNQHVQSVVYMIAERAADFLKAQYGQN
jgi:choline dehydrogenase